MTGAAFLWCVIVLASVALLLIVVAALSVMADQ
jgi:hypothetical protein